MPDENDLDTKVITLCEAILVQVFVPILAALPLLISGLAEPSLVSRRRVS